VTRNPIGRRGWLPAADLCRLLGVSSRTAEPERQAREQVEKREAGRKQFSARKAPVKASEPPVPKREPPEPSTPKQEPPEPPVPKREPPEPPAPKRELTYEERVRGFLKTISVRGASVSRVRQSERSAGAAKRGP
jgi:hypothetical protein